MENAGFKGLCQVRISQNICRNTSSHYATLDEISTYRTVSYRSDLQLIHQLCLRQCPFNCISSVTMSALFRNKCVTKALNSPLLAAVHFRKSLVSQRCHNPSCYQSTSRQSVQGQKFWSGSARTVRKKCLGLVSESKRIVISKIKEKEDELVDFVFRDFTSSF